MEFKNNNGKLFEIIEQKGSYTLMKEKKEVYEDFEQPYIVAYDANSERGDWGQGHYYEKLEHAQETFNQKTM